MALTELIKAVSQQMQAGFEQSRKKFGSSVDIGADRVNILKDFLINYLPRYYGFGNGEIIDSYDNRSGQVDIIVCNEFHPYTYSKEGLGLFLAEGVDWAIEVKSNLATDLKRGMLQVRGIKQLKKKPQEGDMVFSYPGMIERNTIYCLLFGYDSPSFGTLRDNIKHLTSQLGLSKEEMPDAVVALNKGIIFNISEGDHLKIEVGGNKKYGIVGMEFKGDTLFEMLVFLSEHTTHMIYQSPIITRYATFPIKVPTYCDE